MSPRPFQLVPAPVLLGRVPRSDSSLATHSTRFHHPAQDVDPVHPHHPLHEHQALLALDGFLRGQAPQAAQPRGSWSFVDGRLSPADSVPTSTTTTTSTSTARVPAPDATLSPDDLFKLLDEISTSGPGTAGAPPPPATPVSPPLVHPSTTTGPFSPSSTSTFTTDSLFPPPPASSLGFDPPFLASSSSTAPSFALPIDQVAPQHSSMSSFAFASKPFDAGASPSLSRHRTSSPRRPRTDLVALLRTRAGDILMPFDLEPASAASAPLDLLAFPVFDHLIGTHAAVPSSSSSAPFHPPAPAHAPSHTDADAAALDALLDSPLGLAASSSSAPSDTSPLSEFLASPMFSLASGAGAGAGDSTVPPSATMSELTLPTPSPYEHAYAYSAAAAYSAPPPSADGSGLAWFPPLPAAAAGPSSSSSSSSVLFGGAPPTPASTILRPLPPPPSLAPAPLSAFAAPPPAAAPIARGTKRPAPTGFRPGAPPLLPLDAPIQSRHSVMPSATSKRVKTSAAEKALLKRAQSSSSSSSATPAPAGAHEPQPAAAAEEEEQGALPADIVAAVERKRLQNTLSARKSRARKQARVQELEGENELLRRRVGELEALLGLAMAGAGAGAGAA